MLNTFTYKYLGGFRAIYILLSSELLSVDIFVPIGYLGISNFNP